MYTSLHGQIYCQCMHVLFYSFLFTFHFGFFLFHFSQKQLPSTCLISVYESRYSRLNVNVKGNNAVIFHWDCVCFVLPVTLFCSVLSKASYPTGSVSEVQWLLFVNKVLLFCLSCVVHCCYFLLHCAYSLQKRVSIMNNMDQRFNISFISFYISHTVHVSKVLERLQSGTE